MRQLITFSITLALLAGPAASAATIIVPDHQPTIQAGIDAAVNGDTVIVRDGTYSGPGSWDIDFGGKAITVTSENGPENCIIDCWTADWQDHRGFIFHSGEGVDSVMRGFTISEGLIEGYWGGGILCRDGSAPLITGNIITDGECFLGAGIACINSSPTIIDNLIQHNYSDDIGAGIFCSSSSPLIAGNTFLHNYASAGGGIGTTGDSAPDIVNNLFLENHQIYPVAGVYWGSGIHCFDTSAVLVENCTFTGHTNDTGGGCLQDDSGALVVRNCILWANDNDIGYSYYAPPPTVTFSCVEEGSPGLGNIASDPQFVTGPLGDRYLSQVAAGQGTDSPCLDTGHGAASAICYTAGPQLTCLHARSTRTDELGDAGTVDMGYHYPDLDLAAAGLGCEPSSGTVPFNASMTASLTNNHPSLTRRLSGRIDVTLASGGRFANWRAGFTNLTGGETYSTTWNQAIPALGTLIGDNVFELRVADVTPAPWNLPPYPPAGDTAMEACTVTANAP